MNNPPAFPTIKSIEHPDNSQMVQDVTSAEGMSLRDYFAAKAMQGTYSAFANDGFWKLISDDSKEVGITTHEYVSAMAYKTADAMLAERSKQI